MGQQVLCDGRSEVPYVTSVFSNERESMKSADYERWRRCRRFLTYRRTWILILLSFRVWFGRQSGTLPDLA